MDWGQVRVDLPSIVGPMTSIFLKMIHDTHKFKEVDAVAKEPEFLVVGLGPTMQLDSSNRESISPEDNQMVDTIASQISEMTKEGIHFEI